jgi:hypothetical protein
MGATPARRQLKRVEDSTMHRILRALFATISLGGVTVPSAASAQDAADRVEAGPAATLEPLRVGPTAAPVLAQPQLPPPPPQSGPRVLLQLDSHTPGQLLYRIAANGVMQPLCVTPCTLQVPVGLFDYALDGQGRDTRILNVPPAGLQLYVDAEAMGGLPSARVDGRAVPRPTNLPPDGSTRIAGQAMMIGGFLVGAAALVPAGVYLGLWGAVRSSSGRDPLLISGVVFGSISVIGLTVGAVGALMSSNSQPQRPPRTVVVATPHGLALFGTF